MPGLGQDRRIGARSLGPARVGVDEVEILAGPESFEEWVIAPRFYLVPADVRQCRRVLQAERAARNDPEGDRAVLVAPVEEELEAEADAEVRTAVGDPAQQRVHEPGASKPAHRRAGGTDAGDDHGVHAFEVLRLHDDAYGRTDAGECLLDAHQVARAIVDDGDPHGTGRRSGNLVDHARLPFVDATPTRRGSGSDAARNARASALNAASAR